MYFFKFEWSKCYETCRSSVCFSQFVSNIVLLQHKNGASQIRENVCFAKSLLCKCYKNPSYTLSKQPLKDYLILLTQQIKGPYHAG